jgi:hypothetical protein
MSESFCVYCQHEYGTKAKLIRHLLAEHPGTYAAHSIAGEAMKAERITDYFVTVIPEAVDVNDVDAFAALREEMQRQVEVMLLRQYERPPKALMLEPTEWLVTDSPDEVEAFQPEHDCAECRAGNQRACEFLIANPGRFVACGNLHYTEVWR